ncbi:retrovirus-related Pol polyprotein from transposon opus [Trichonephila clavipes]|nr:retrovirus-related Pol polyprotein from transposon opus [Trichonephila clavipes]
MDKGIMVADSFRSEQECCAELALVWKYTKEGKGNYYEVDGYLFRRDKILGESIGQLVIPKCRRTEVLKLAHTSVFSSHMGSKKTLERIKYSFFWEGLRADVKKFCDSCKERQLTRSVRIKDRSSSTPVARPELPFEVGNMDLIGPIDPPSLKGHKYILRLVDQHTRWGEAVPLTSLSAKLLPQREMANNQSVRRHLDTFTRGRIIGKLEKGRSVTSVAPEFGIAHSIVSRLWRQFQTTGTAIREFSSGRP